MIDSGDLVSINSRQRCVPFLHKVHQVHGKHDIIGYYYYVRQMCSMCEWQKNDVRNTK